MIYSCVSPVKVFFDFILSTTPSPVISSMKRVSTLSAIYVTPIAVTIPPRLSSLINIIPSQAKKLIAFLPPCRFALLLSISVHSPLSEKRSL